MTLEAFLRRVVGILDEARVPYMLTGSLAAAYYATPRSTRDVDVVVSAEGEGVARLAEGLSSTGWYVDPASAQEAVRVQGQFNAIDPETGWKVDLIIRKDRPFSRAEFERRRKVSLLGVDTWMATLEDVLIAKLEWSKLGDSELQRRDVAQLLEREGEGLDLRYVERWIGELGLGADWKALRARQSPRE